MGLLDLLKRGLSRTRQFLGERLNALFAPLRRVDDGFLDELHETLILADVGPEVATEVVEGLRRAWKLGKVKQAEEAKAYLREEFLKLLAAGSEGLRFAPSPPTVVLVMGVNGSGKTTSIAKLARYYRDEKKKVLLAAGDTFRAAAIEQLAIWAERLGVEIIHHKPGGDPGAVVFDAAEAALARGSDLVLVDTAGRLQTKEHLMRELSKIKGVLARKIPGAPHESILVLDATTGQNALSQAEHFGAAAELTGIFLAKLDGTAKGGVVLTIKKKLGVPVRFVGVGETPEDLLPFNAAEFVDALLSPGG